METLKAYKHLEVYQFLISGQVKRQCQMLPTVLWWESAMMPDHEWLSQGMGCSAQEISFSILCTLHLHGWVCSLLCTYMWQPLAMATCHSCTFGHNMSLLLYSLGEVCSHVAAVLFTIEAAVKLGLTKASSTNEACQWNSTFRESVGTTFVSHAV